MSSSQSVTNQRRTVPEDVSLQQVPNMVCWKRSTLVLNKVPSEETLSLLGIGHVCEV